MCGRFRLQRPWSDIHTLYKLTDQPARNLQPRYNIAPTQPILTIRQDAQGGRTAADLRWGLIPSWSADGKGLQINARSETVSEKPMFRAAFKARRCLVVADGYYEWETIGEGRKAEKLPWLFEVGDDELLAFAGIWERWAKGPDGPIETVALMTTSPNALCATVHDRMPVLLDPSEFETWLNVDTPEGDVKALLDAYPDDRMRKRRVSKKINSARYDGPELVENVDV